jgi:adenylate cyclase
MACSCHYVVAGHQGRIVQQIGDGVLAEFASVVDAVQCAVELQRRNAEANAAALGGSPLVLRIGVNLGDVVVDGLDIQGDGVNVAARLEAMADPGGMCISASVFEQVDRRVLLTYEDMGNQSLKNISRPVHVYRIGRDAGVGKTHKAPPSTTKPSIAVLPFSNMSGDPEQDYFSDGVTEDIITELSRFHSLFVIARNSTFVYKGRSTKVQDIARDLNVDYVVEGSVRRSGGRVRVTAQLIEAQTGHHLWAERYDRDLGDIFALQDEMAQRIVTSIAPRLHAEETGRARRRAPEDLRAHDHYLRAKFLIDVPKTAADIERGRSHCEMAIAIDPTHARAHAYLAFSYIVGDALSPTDHRSVELGKALQSAERALTLDGNDNVCHWALGESAFHAGQIERALDHMGRALALNPNDADVLIVSGYIQCGVGDAELGLCQVAMAMERNPSSPTWYHWLHGICLCLHGRFTNALVELDRYVPPNPNVMKWRAFALAKLGRTDEARAQIADLLAIQPKLRTSTLACYSVEIGRVRDDFLATMRDFGVPD